MPPRKTSSVTSSGSITPAILKVAPNVKRYSDISNKPSILSVGKYGVMFSSVKQRHDQEDYCPDDDLEKWLLQHTEKDLALTLEHPTHISQRGGHYHIIFHTKQMYEDYINAWRTSLEKNQTMFVEELRTKHVFRLYLDIDIKLTNEEPFDIVKQGWLDSILKFTKEYFPKCNTSLALTQCHGKWEDAVVSSAKFKSGYRLYFHEILVDYDKYCDYTHQLYYKLQDELGGKYDYQPEDWTFDQVIDLKTCNHPRCRLFGSSKWRRSNILPRVYEFYGFFKDYGKGGVAQYDEKLSKQMRDNVNLILKWTGVRVEDPFD